MHWSVNAVVRRCEAKLLPSTRKQKCNFGNSQMLPVNLLSEFEFKRIKETNKKKRKESNGNRALHLTATRKRINQRHSCCMHSSGKHVRVIYPLEPHFYIEKLGYAGIYLIPIFLIFAPKHRLWVLVRTASTRRF